MVIIDVNKLVREYKVDSGWNGLSGYLIPSKPKILRAVDGISFSIARGEMVGFVGPNGAGKSTTIKILSGILVPTSGTVLVNGLVPHKKRKENAKKIGLIFGQRTQLWWELPVIDSFTFLKHIYEVPDSVFKHNMDMYYEIFNLKDFINQPVRQLSLGQRMLADITAAMLHSPEILFLDEPTIGLDIVAKAKIRDLIRQVNAETGVTLLLTTHDMWDVERLCDRLMIIDKGRLIYDGGVDKLKEKVGGFCELVVDSKKGIRFLEYAGAELLKTDGGRCWIRFDRNKVKVVDLIGNLMSKHEIIDFSLITPNIEGIIKSIYDGEVQL